MATLIAMNEYPKSTGFTFVVSIITYADHNYRHCARFEVYEKNVETGALYAVTSCRYDNDRDALYSMKAWEDYHVSLDGNIFERDIDQYEIW